MVNGEIFFARYPLTIDTKEGPIQADAINTNIFRVSEFDIIASEIIPISGGSGKTNAVMLVIARSLI